MVSAGGRGPERRQEGRDPFGQGRDAVDELVEVAERLGAPIIKALLGKAAVPDDSPTRPAASVCSAPGRRTRRWKSAIRC